jgi:alcohol dehydrogenase, propanol-preferring
MQSLRLTEWKHEVELQEVPQPEPGPGEVLVRIGGAGACHSDLHLMEDFSSGMVGFEPPFTVGHENAGWIEAFGEGVTGCEIGEPVAVYGPWGCGRCHRCQAGMENYCERQSELGAMGGGLGHDGGMAAYMLVPSPRFLVPLGDLDPIHGAPLTDAGLTPYHAVKRSLPLLIPGATAVVIGIGGLGHLAVQLLRELTPARIIAVDEREEALQIATEGGADLALVGDAGTAEAIGRATRGRGADVVLDFVGVDQTLQLGASVVRPLGHLTIVGLGGGNLEFNFFSIAYEASVATTYWGSLPELMEVIDLAASGRIAVRVEQHPLSAAVEVYRALRSGEIEGRAVVVP